MRKLLTPAAPAKSDPAKAGYVGRLTSPIAMTLKVEAGKTYLVEMLNAVANFSDHTPQLRLEVAVTGQKSKNLPCTVRLPVGRYLTRQRSAFRADTTGKVKLTLRAVLPLTTGEGKKAKTTYKNAAPRSNIPVLLGDVVVSAIQFPGRNLVFDGGPGAGTEPAGGLTCMVYPWRDGVSRPRGNDPYKNLKAAIKLVNGHIANQETAWAGAGGVDKTVVYVRFKKPQVASSIVIYEDISGPVPGGDSVRERTASRYSIDILNAATGKWSRLGHVFDNTQTINIFPCPDHEISQVRYTWAGKHDAVFAGRTDGAVRTAQIEVYSSADEEILNSLEIKDDPLELDDAPKLD
jgi:hypothetical protein